MKNYAYVSLLATNNYIGAAVTMMEAGKRTKPAYPYYLMITENITQENREILEVLGYKLLNIQEWRPETYDAQRGNVTNESVILWHGTNTEDKGWQHVFSKFLCWNLTQFDKICVLDIDILLFKNIDDIFELTAPAWMGPDVNGFSAGYCFMIEPNEAVFKKLIDYGNHFEGDKELLFNDEAVFQEFFHQEIAENKTIPLTYVYSWDRCSTEFTFIEDSFNIRGVHMAGTDKPWLKDRSYVANYNNVWYPAAFIWNYYISIYNLSATKLNQKGFNLPIIN